MRKQQNKPKENKIGNLKGCLTAKLIKGGTLAPSSYSLAGGTIIKTFNSWVVLDIL